MKISRAIARGMQQSRNESAQGVVEFALMATILFFIFLGTVDFARFLYYQNAVASAARIGAEAASNHCAFSSAACARTSAPTSDTVVLWATYCEATPWTQLQPTYTSCDPGGSMTWTPTCAGLCSNCTQDICVSPSTRSQGTQVSVSVGYTFKPLTLLMAPFLPDRSCFTGDTASTNHHTLCSTFVGQVS